jgi:hypothetical protein
MRLILINPLRLRLCRLAAIALRKRLVLDVDLKQPGFLSVLECVVNSPLCPPAERHQYPSFRTRMATAADTSSIIAATPTEVFPALLALHMITALHILAGLTLS